MQRTPPVRPRRPVRTPLRRVARVLGVTLAALIVIAVVVPILYDVLARPVQRPAVTLPMPPEGRYTIHVADWGYHTSITLPQPEEWSLGPSGRERAARVEFAWGDRAFYRDSDFRPHAVFATLVLPTASVAYVAGRDQPPGSGARAVYAREVDARTLHTLATELERTIRRGATGSRVTPAPPVAGYAGRFYDAHSQYLWTRNCNRWTVDRLAAAGLAEPRRSIVLAGQVASRLIGFRKVVGPEG